MSSGVTESEARALALQGVVEISRGIDFAVAEIRAGRFMVAAETLLLAKAGCVVTEAAIQKIRYRESTPAPMTCDAAAELLRGYAPGGVTLHAALLAARAKTIPEKNGGSREAWDRVETAAAVLGLTS